MFFDHAYRQQGHLHDRIPASGVVPSCELTDVAVEMLDAHPIVGAVIASLHYRPE